MKAVRRLRNMQLLVVSVRVFGGGGALKITLRRCERFGGSVSRIVTPLNQSARLNGAPRLSREPGATRFQIGVGQTLGLSKQEIRFLREVAAHPEKYWRFEVQ